MKCDKLVLRIRRNRDGWRLVAKAGGRTSVICLALAALLATLALIR